MQNKIKLVFIIEIIIYIGLLFGLPYVSVYITYVSIPIIVFTGILGFINFKQSPHNIAKFTFFGTLVLWSITIATVTYVGVYLSWVVVPILAVSGITYLLSKPKELKI